MMARILDQDQRLNVMSYVDLTGEQVLAAPWASSIREEGPLNITVTGS